MRVLSFLSAAFSRIKKARPNETGRGTKSENNYDENE